MDVYLKGWLLHWRGGSNPSLREEGSSLRSASRRCRPLRLGMGSISHRFTMPTDHWRANLTPVGMVERRASGHSRSCHVRADLMERTAGSVLFWCQVSDRRYGPSGAPLPSLRNSCSWGLGSEFVFRHHTRYLQCSLLVI